MNLFDYRNVELDVCPKCAGVWLDGEEVQALFGEELSNRLSSEYLISRVTRSAFSEVDDILDALFWYDL